MVLRRPRGRTLAALAALSALAAVAVMPASGQAQQKMRIGYVLPDLSNPFIAGLRDGAVTQAKKKGVDLLVKGTNDAAGQTNAVQNYVSAKVDAIAVDAIDGDAIGPAVVAANKAGIPVIAIQAQPRKGKVATFIAADNKQGGVLIGKAIVQYCKGKNPCKLGIVEGNLADQSGRDENSGVRSTVAKSKNIQIVGNQPTNYDPQKALNVATNLLTANPDLNYIYSWWDQGALAAMEAVRSKNKLKAVGISGFGGNCQNLAEVIKGNIYSETMFFPQQMGAQMVDSALSAIKGRKLPKVTPAPIFSMTAPLSKQFLSGKGSAPAVLKPQIVSKLREARAGCKG
jgi:ABC-type sugar transport system substrate-binding protein